MSHHRSPSMMASPIPSPPSRSAGAIRHPEAIDGAGRSALQGATVFDAGQSRPGGRAYGHPALRKIPKPGWSLWLTLLLLLWASLGAAFAGPSIEELRMAQQKELDTLRQTYNEKVRANPALIKPDGSVNKEHPAYTEILTDYARAKAEIQVKHSKEDPRGAAMKDLEKQYGKGAVTATGSAPKDVRADVDLTASTTETADKVAADWKAKGDSVEYDPKLGIYINKTQDTTLWAPPSPEQAQARQSYHDSFSTPGGKQATGVKGGEAVRDPEGFVLDNEKKFIHAAGDLNKAPEGGGDPAKQLERDMALKTAGKSVSKAAESVGQESQVVKQGQSLRNYKDEYETGITTLGDPPEKQQKDVKEWVGKADQQIQNAKGEAEKRSQTITDTRDKLADSVQGKPGGAETAEAIRARNEKVATENAKAKAANEEARKNAGLSSAPPRDDAATGTSAKAPPSEPGKSVTTQEGKSANTTWQTTKEKEGDTTRTTTHTTATDKEGGTRTTDKVTETGKTPGSGKTTGETSTVTQTGADGTTTQTTQKTSGYTGPADKSGKQTGVTTQTTTESQTGADGTTKSTTSKSTTHTTQDGEGGTKSQTITTAKGTETGKDGSQTETQSTTISNKSGGGDDGDGPGRTSTTSKSTTTDSSGGVTTTHTETGTESDGEGGKTTTTTTKTEAPHTTSGSTEWGYEKGFKPGDGDEGGDKQGESSPPKVGVKLAGGELIDTKNDAKETGSLSGATTTVGGVEVAGETKVEVGQTGAKGTWEVTTDKEGLKGKAEVSGEANVIKITGTGSAEKEIIDGVTVGGKVTGTAKVGGEVKGTVEGVVGPDKIGVSAEGKVFVGGKAELEAETSISILGIKLTGKGQAEVSYGAGAEVKIDGELSWTKIKVGGKLAGTLGLGTGGSANVEIDATTLITGVDLEQVGRQQAAAEGITQIIHDLRSGKLTLPPGVKFSDIRKTLQDKADWFAKYPQKDGKGKPITLADSLAKTLNLGKGKPGAYVTAQHQQKDWYCTNRPQIEAPVGLPPIVTRK